MEKKNLNQLVKMALNHTTNGNYIFYPYEYEKYGFKNPTELEDAIWEFYGEKVADIHIGQEKEVDVVFWLNACPNIDPDIDFQSNDCSNVESEELEEVVFHFLKKEE